MNGMAENARIKTRVESVLEDPSAQAVAQVYSDAFLGGMPEGEAAGALEELRSFLGDVLEKSATLWDENEHR